MAERIDTVVIGGGQAGLAMSYHLQQHGREHVVLERHRAGEAWRSRRWDSFTLVTPNWSLRLPGFPYDGDDPDGFLTRNEVVQYLDDYIALINPPLRLGVEVYSIKGKDSGGFRIETNTGSLEADNVVVATGIFQKPKIPPYSRKISPHVRQMHTSHYQNPQELPPGAVLVAGSGQSGCQITEELYQAGRKVYLCTGGGVRAPRRYRGKDFAWWAVKLGILDKTVDELDSPAERFKANPHVTGKDGGRSLNLHQFALDGVILLGRLLDSSGSKVVLAGNLKENLAKADQASAELLKGIDAFIEKSGIEAAEDEELELRAGYESEVITELDLEAAGITSIIWATGFTYDFSWVNFPILDEYGYPRQKRGVTEYTGLYFVGLHWLHTLKSGLFAGVGDDAAHIAEHMASLS